MRSPEEIASELNGLSLGLAKVAVIGLSVTLFAVTVQTGSCAETEELLSRDGPETTFLGVVTLGPLALAVLVALVAGVVAQAGPRLVRLTGRLSYLVSVPERVRRAEAILFGCGLARGELEARVIRLVDGSGRTLGEVAPVRGVGALLLFDTAGKVRAGIAGTADGAPPMLALFGDQDSCVRLEATAEGARLSLTGGSGKADLTCSAADGSSFLGMRDAEGRTRVLVGTTVSSTWSMLRDTSDRDRAGFVLANDTVSAVFEPAPRAGTPRSREPTGYL